MKVTTEKYTCDRCGYESSSHMDWRGGECGSANLKWNEQCGAMGVYGGSGGTSNSGEAWLCQECRKAFLSFMKEK